MSNLAHMCSLSIYLSFEFICNFIQFTFILFVAFCHLVKRSQLRCCHYCLWYVRWLLLLCHATTNTLSKYKDRINAGQIVIQTHTPRKYARYALFIEKRWLRSARWSSARKKTATKSQSLLWWRQICAVSHKKRIIPLSLRSRKIRL